MKQDMRVLRVMNLRLSVSGVRSRDKECNYGTICSDTVLYNWICVVSLC